MGISSIAHKGLRRLYENDDARGVRTDLVKKLQRVLFALETAATIEELNRFPGWRLHQLKGDLKDFWSISVSGNWRLIFRFDGGEASGLDLVDYH